MSAPASELRRTALHGRHAAAGARLVPFAGWEMPVQYADGIRAEHEAVRTHAGVFDVSHMGEIETCGPQAAEFLQHLLSNDIRKIPEGGAQYSVLCLEDGGIVDDLFTYRLAERHFLTVTNAANHDKDLAYFHQQAEGFDVDVNDRAGDFAMLAVQGPNARTAVARLTDGALPSRFHCCTRVVAGVPMLVCGTGYTGEDGVELLLDPAQAETVWDGLIAAGVRPIGLAARDTLRLEVNYHLYGNDMDETRNPIEAGLGWACKEDTGFVGSDAVRRARTEGTAEKLVAFVMTDPGIARQGNPVVGGGVVTSGTMSPSLGIGIGMAYVPAGKAEPGTPLEIDVRGKARAAEVRPKPLYRSESG
ncbi:MAG: aminomethyltransferase [Solirubrobacteraceae bacterium]|nr:aminomethyltransferase [Solirubrobacteraceae bacterium]